RAGRAGDRAASRAGHQDRRGDVCGSCNAPCGKMNFTYAPPPGPPELIHADHEILGVNKPAGLLSVPGRGAEKAECLIGRLRAAFPTVLLVHRLDLDTSGVMIFGLTPHAQRNLSKQFEERKVKKTYVAR